MRLSRLRSVHRLRSVENRGLTHLRLTNDVLATHKTVLALMYSKRLRLPTPLVHKTFAEDLANSEKILTVAAACARA